jgi:Apea-like HEPN
MFSFRNRLIISSPLAAPDDRSRFVVPGDSDGELVEILGPQGDEKIQDAMELRLRGSGYDAPEDAIDAGKLWRDRLTVAFAHYEKGIEIGSSEAPEVPEWSGGQPYFIYQLGRVMRDAPKLTVFPTNQEPNWGGFFAEGVVAHGIERFIDGHLAWVRERECRLNAQQQLAYKLFHASLFESNPEARYILLFTGIEALIPERFRAEPYINALEQLRSYLATLDDVERSIKDSIRGFLSYKDNESIRYRGRNWVQFLAGDTFGDKTPEEYFLHAYEARNSLAHGNVGRPTAESLNQQIPELRRYLLALLDMDMFGELMPGLMDF